MFPEPKARCMFIRQNWRWKVYVDFIEATFDRGLRDWIRKWRSLKVGRQFVSRYTHCFQVANRMVQ